MSIPGSDVGGGSSNGALVRVFSGPKINNNRAGERVAVAEVRIGPILRALLPVGLGLREVGGAILLGAHNMVIGTGVSTK